MADTSLTPDTSQEAALKFLEVGSSVVFDFEGEHLPGTTTTETWREDDGWYASVTTDKQSWETIRAIVERSGDQEIIDGFGIVDRSGLREAKSVRIVEVNI
jgi:hypothetical protein